ASSVRSGTRPRSRSRVSALSRYCIGVAMAVLAVLRGVDAARLANGTRLELTPSVRACPSRVYTGARAYRQAVKLEPLPAGPAPRRAKLLSLRNLIGRGVGAACRRTKHRESGAAVADDRP